MQLTTEQIRAKSAELVEGIRQCIKERPRNTKRAQVLALQLRQLNRHSNFRLKKLREALSTVRAEAEQAALAQNNLCSEIAHIKRNIAHCREFR